MCVCVCVCACVRACVRAAVLHANVKSGCSRHDSFKMLRVGRATMRCRSSALRGHWPPQGSFSRLKSAAAPTADCTIDRLKTQLEDRGISVVTTGARVKAKSRDYYWFSPVLRGRLADKAADAVVAPKNEAEVVEVLRACHKLGVPVTVRGACRDTSSALECLAIVIEKLIFVSVKKNVSLGFVTHLHYHVHASRRWDRELWPGCAFARWRSA